MQQDYEKLGLFYLGRRYDLEARARRDELVLYDSADLVTHAVCVGMTGSGKTGLCLALLEEAAIDGIPAIAIDPKGDLANLLLQFPDLRPADFEPWIDADEARRNDATPAEWAARAAQAARQGLADWDQPPERIRKLADSAEFVIYTPGSSAGLALSILRSFAAPPAAILDDSEAFQGRVAGTATSLLGLLGIDADPLQSREHILLANLLDRAWREGRDLDLAALIGLIQSPPLQRIGVLELEAFFPAKERFALALRLNNLLASPAFATWMEGEPLDVGKLLWNAHGKPRVVILSIAHLSDAERMFFVSLVLNETLAWMRAQRGTSSLRALLYMDEIFGYFPPVANPPSKTALLTLLKQARAFGLGIVLATQNPVDLDYKGLSNCGTWFVGRLQTERDKARLLDGLEGAAAPGPGGFDRARMEQTLSALGKRVFLMNDVHETGPVIFETRQVLSYLRGPLTRAEIKTLMAPWRAAAGQTTARPGDASPAAAPPAKTPAADTVPASAPASPGASAPALEAAAAGTTSASNAANATNASGPARSNGARPVLPPEIPERFLPVRVPPPPNARLVYEPGLYAKALLYVQDAKLGVDAQSLPIRFAPLSGLSVDWDHAEKCTLDESALEAGPSPVATFAPLPPEACKGKSYETWKKQFVDSLFRLERLELWKCESLGAVSAPGESERDFRLRLGDNARAARDLAKEKLRQRFAPKVESLQERLRRAQQTVDREAEQARDSKVGGTLSFGASLLGAFLGRKTLSAANVGRAATAARSVGRMQKEAADVGRAEDNAKALQSKLAALAAELDAEIAASDAGLDPLREPLVTLALRPKKSNISARVLTLAWAPVFVSPTGERTPAWQQAGPAPAR